jgi:Flp pilus assembly protein TadB
MSVAQRELGEQAKEYAWNWFEYHAGQRQSVFRFYLVICGALVAGIISTEKTDVEIRFLLTISLAVSSLLFWQLDRRSTKLIKLAEEYLKEWESQISAEIKSPLIRLVERSDSERPIGFTAHIHSFRQIYKSIYILFIVFSFILLVSSIDFPGIIHHLDELLHCKL